MHMRVEWSKAKMNDGEITSLKQLGELVELAENQSVRIYVVWFPDNWMMASGTIIPHTLSSDNRHVDCTDVTRTDHSHKGRGTFYFSIGDTTPAYQHNRYFTNYWFAYGYYTRMRAKSV